MLAVGLGQSMGLSPAESLYRIDVIQGKPTASAELIAANVRKAGHKLRLRVDEQAVSATCTIIRADDPGTSTPPHPRPGVAQKMGLSTKDNYKKQPATMLGWRAVTAAARMACPEALYGVAYSSDEMFDGTSRPESTPSGGLGAALSQQVTVEQVHDEPEPVNARPPVLTRQEDARHLPRGGIDDRADRLAFAADTVGREIESSTETHRGRGQSGSSPRSVGAA